MPALDHDTPDDLAHDLGVLLGRRLIEALQALDDPRGRGVTTLDSGVRRPRGGGVGPSAG